MSATSPVVVAGIKRQRPNEDDDTNNNNNNRTTVPSATITATANPETPSSSVITTQGSSLSASSSFSSSGWMVHWIRPTTAQVVVVPALPAPLVARTLQSSTGCDDNEEVVVGVVGVRRRLCVQGRGRIVNRGRRRSVEILGVTLRPHNDNDNTTTANSSSSSSIEFDSPGWSSWVTMDLTSDDAIQITNAGDDHDDNETAGGGVPSFVLYDARHDPEARPTWIPPSWKTTVETIWKDYYYREHHHQQPLSSSGVMMDRTLDALSSTATSTTPITNSNMPPPLQQQHARASYYQQDSLGWNDDDDDNDSNPPFPDCLSSRNPNTENSTNTDNGFVIVVSGAKGVGKSTLVRYCCNRYLSSDEQQQHQQQHPIAVLDADPVQPEWCVPGMLQLTLVHRPTLWPPHRQLTEIDNNNNNNNNKKTATVVLAHYYGSVTSATDPTLYLQCMASLVQAYRNLLVLDAAFDNNNNNNNCHRPIPLLVNLDGWVQGLGLQILTTLLQDIVRPHHVIQLVGDSVAKQPAFLGGGWEDNNNSKNGDHATTALYDGGSCCHWHHCWAYNSQQEEAAVWGCGGNSNNRTKSNSNTNNISSKQSSKPQQRQSETNASAPVLTCDNNNNNIDDDDIVDEQYAPSDTPNDDTTASMPAPIIFPAADGTTVSSSTQRRHRMVPTATAWPATVFRQIRLVSYFMQPSVIGNNNNKSKHLWDQCRPAFFGVDDPDNIIADALAAARPYVVSVDAVRILSTTAAITTGAAAAATATTDLEQWDLWNASLVGLCSGGDVRRSEEEEEHSSPLPAALLPCLGLGLIRAVDRVRRLLYILTPCCCDLSQVTVLTMGSVEQPQLPLACYFRGVHSEAFPYQSFVSVGACNSNNNTTANGTNGNFELIGADPMKSRNNIARRATSINYR